SLPETILLSDLLVLRGLPDRPGYVGVAALSPARPRDAGAVWRRAGRANSHRPRDSRQPGAGDVGDLGATGSGRTHNAVRGRNCQNTSGSCPTASSPWYR